MHLYKTDLPEGAKLFALIYICSLFFDTKTPTVYSSIVLVSFST